MPQEQQRHKSVNVPVDQNALKGIYSNLMQVSHSKEEVVLDFFLNMPPGPILGSRVIINPSHLKRIATVLSQTLKKYEEQFGTINEGTSQAKSEFGFQTQS
ncbi:MAG: DUF3467 domain-containing protein [Candidatus Doudnabacteria bacterium]|nr:DUF3467 domain-containing protein [Candidatus Doudnabacteria bacterium]